VGKEKGLGRCHNNSATDQQWSVSSATVANVKREISDGSPFTPPPLMSQKRKSATFCPFVVVVVRSRVAIVKFPATATNFEGKISDGSPPRRRRK
jgi:hypothetical protein